MPEGCHVRTDLSQVRPLELGPAPDYRLLRERQYQEGPGTSPLPTPHSRQRQRTSGCFERLADGSSERRHQHKLPQGTECESSDYNWQEVNPRTADEVGLLGPRSPAPSSGPAAMPEAS